MTVVCLTMIHEGLAREMQQGVRRKELFKWGPGTKLRWWYWRKNELNEVLWSWRCSQYHATVMRFESKQNYLCQYRYVYVQLCSPLIHLIE